MLWRCWLGCRKGILLVNKVSGGVLAWLSGWREVQTCVWPSWCHCYSLSLASVKSRFFTVLVPAHLGSPGQSAIKRVCVCVCVLYFVSPWIVSKTDRKFSKVFQCVQSINLLSNKDQRPLTSGIVIVYRVQSVYTQTHLYNGPLSGTTWVSRHQKGKTLDFTKARDSEWQWHQLGHMQVGTMLQA